VKFLFLLRHAKSSWRDPDLDDFDRPLNKRGRQSARLLAEYFTLHRIRPSLVLCSSSRRTRQTCDLLAKVLEGAAIHYETTLYEAGARELLERLNKVPETVKSLLVIGHNPGTERLASLLADESRPHNAEALARLREKYPTGGLTSLTLEGVAWADLAAGKALVTGFVRPNDLDPSEED